MLYRVRMNSLVNPVCQVVVGAANEIEAARACADHFMEASMGEPLPPNAIYLVSAISLDTYWAFDSDGMESSGAKRMAYSEAFQELWCPHRTVRL